MDSCRLAESGSLTGNDNDSARPGLYTFAIFELFAVFVPFPTGLRRTLTGFAGGSAAMPGARTVTAPRGVDCPHRTFSRFPFRTHVCRYDEIRER